MAEYRVGRSWGVTIVREGDRTPEGHIVGADELVAVITNGDRELAERICALLNGDDTAEQEATIQELKTRLATWAEQIDGDGDWSLGDGFNALREMRQTASEL